MTGLRHSRLALAAVMLGLAAAPSVGEAAAVREHPGVASSAAGTYLPVTGPRLAGRDLVWLQPRADRGVTLYRAAPGEKPRRVVGMARPTPDFYTVAQLVASPQALLVQQTLVSRSRDIRTLGDPRGLGTAQVLGDGSLRRLSGRCWEPICVRPSLDLSGSTALFASDGPDPSVVIRDLNDAADRGRSLPKDGSSAQIAGRYAAWKRNRSIRVFDLQTGAVAYDVAGIPISGEQSVGDLDLDATGAVVFAYDVLHQRQTRQRLGWASPAEPRFHSVGVAPRTFYRPRLVNNRVVFARPARQFRSIPSEIGSARLGGKARVLVRPVETDLSGAPFDFDGQRVAWVGHRCAGPRVYSAALATLSKRPFALKVPRCRLVLNRFRRAGKRVAIRVSCRGFEHHCQVGSVSIRLGRTYRAGGRRYRRGTVLGEWRGGFRDSARVRLNSRALRLLSRRVVPLVRVTATIAGIRGIAVERRSGRVRLD